MAKLQVNTEEHPLTCKRHWVREEIALRDIDIVYLKLYILMDV